MMVTGKQKISGWKSGEISGRGVADSDSQTWFLSVNYTGCPHTVVKGKKKK